MSLEVVFTFRRELKQFLYDDGKGKDISINEIVQKRSEERASKTKAINDQRGIKSMFYRSPPTSFPLSFDGTGKLRQVCSCKQM